LKVPKNATAITATMTMEGYANNAIDQQNPAPTSGSRFVNNSVWQAQSFKPTASELKEVEINFDVYTSEVITVSIRADSSGNPSSSDIVSASKTISASGWSKFNLSANLTVGNIYWVVIKGSTSGNVLIWYTNENYADGAWKETTNSGGSWTLKSGDIAFRTYSYQYPSDVIVDTGSDGYGDIQVPGTLSSSLANLDLNKTAIQNYIYLNMPDENGFVLVPLKISSDSGGIVQLNTVSLKHYSNKTFTGLKDG